MYLSSPILLQTLPYFTELLIMQEQQVEMMSEYLISRFKTLLENNREDDALSIMEEYILPNGEIEDDNYQWLFINDLTELKGAN